MATKKVAKKDMLDEFAELANKDPKQALALVLWKMRHENPEMSVLITEKDLTGLRDCATYLDVVPDVRIFRRPAIPAHDAVPAAPGRVAINAFPGAPAAAFVTVAMVAKGTEDTFKPIENNEEDAVKGENAAELRRLKAELPGLATLVNNQAAGGTFSAEQVMEVCRGAVLLAQAK